MTCTHTTFEQLAHVERETARLQREKNEALKARNMPLVCQLIDRMTFLEVAGFDMPVATFE